MSNQALGGGFIKVEPFFEEASPTNNPKNTLYIHSKPEDPKIIAAEWYGFDENKNIKKIENTVSTLSKVELHIYTYDLYGQNIRIELKENGKTLKANSYEEGFVINSHKDNAKSKGDDNVETTYEINESEDFFLFGN